MAWNRSSPSLFWQQQQTCQDVNSFQSAHIMCESMLLTLPEELVAYIADYIPVDSIVNFALSCSATFRHTKYRLARNQIFHAESRLQHDRQPLHASDTLRRALSDPDTIWHLRDFESWGVRPGFGKWKSWSFQYDIPDGYSIEPYEDHSALDSNFYKPSEMIVYRMIMMDKLHMSVEEVYKWTERIRDGWDEPIKGILFAIAPMLDRLNFIAYALR